MRQAAIVIVPDPERPGWFLSIDRPDRGVEAPGGELKPGETPEEAALRGVAEETGVLVRRLRPITRGPVAPGPDGITYHVTVFGGEFAALVGPGEERLRPAWRPHDSFRANLPRVCRAGLDAMVRRYGPARPALPARLRREALS